MTFGFLLGGIAERDGIIKIIYHFDSSDKMKIAPWVRLEKDNTLESTLKDLRVI
jgi:hypothetical protein